VRRVHLITLKTIPTQSPDGTAAGALLKDPIRSMPEDLQALLGASSLPESIVMPKFISIPNLFGLIGKIQAGIITPFLVVDAVSIAEKLEKRDPCKPYLFPVRKGEEVAYLGLYDYPDYRFLDWICSDVDIRLAHYTCVVPSK
jgi:hypothetical protein